MNKPSLLLGLAASLTVSTAAWSHHSFAMFDLTRTVTYKGKVKEFQWTNPHIWLQVAVEQPGGKTVEWGFEALNIAAVKQLGWTSASVKPGDMVTVQASPARNGSARASLRSVTLADGRVLTATTRPLGSNKFSIEGAAPGK